MPVLLTLFLLIWSLILFPSHLSFFSSYASLSSLRHFRTSTFTKPHNPAIIMSANDYYNNAGGSGGYPQQQYGQQQQYGGGYPQQQQGYPQQVRLVPPKQALRLLD